jgi:hypothetical protein
MLFLFLPLLSLVSSAYRTLDIGDYKTCVVLTYPEGTIKCWGERREMRSDNKKNNDFFTYVANISLLLQAWVLKVILRWVIFEVSADRPTLRR